MLFLVGKIFLIAFLSFDCILDGYWSYPPYKEIMVLELKAGYKTFDTTYVWYKIYESGRHRNVVWYIGEGKSIWIRIIAEPDCESAPAMRNLFKELRRSTLTHAMP